MAHDEISEAVVITVTDDTFADAVLASAKPVLVDFWAQWCPSCRMLSPVLDEIAAEEADRLVVATINVDENQVIAQKYGILTIPALSLFRDGDRVLHLVGARTKRRLLAALGEVLSAHRVA